MIYTVEDKQKSSSIVVIILLILAINHCNAQITISQRQPAGNDYNLNNLLDISVNNSTQMNTPVYLTASVINEENNEVLRCRKENIELLPGITLIDSKTLSNVKYRYSDNAFEAYTKENSSFPPGFYKVTVVAKSAVDDAELGQSVTEFTISRPAGALKAGQQYEKKVSPVKFSGFSEVFGDYSTCRGTNTEVPPAYAWLNINSDVSIYSIPVNISGLLSSAGNDGRQDVNTYSISFNSEKFNENLKNRASGIIREKTASVKEQDKVSRELNKLNRIFGNPQVQTELKQIKEIDSIEKQISTTNDTAELRILSEELSGYETLQKKREGYQRLIARKEKLDKLNSIYKETGDAAEYGKKIDYGVSMNVASFLSEEGAISGFEKAVSKVRNFHLGTCYPYYSPLTMAGMPVNGIYAETEIKNIYAVFSAGNLRRPAITNDMLHASYKRKLLSGGVGYGRKDGSHIHFHILDVCDDSSSVDIRNDIYGYHSTPKSNRVISTDIRYDLIKNILLIEAELAGSYHVNDMWLDAEPEITVDSSVYEFQNSNNVFGKIFTQKTDNFSSSVDYAYRINLQSFIPVTKTGLKVEAKRVGRDFISLGLPYLITDLMSYKLEMKQDFWKRRIAFSGFLKYNRDNLDGDNALTSRFLQPGGYVSLQIPRLPGFRVSYTPVIQRNDSMYYYSNALTASVSHRYRTGKIIHVTTLIYNVIKSDNNLSDSEIRYSAEHYTLNHVLSFKIPLSIMLNGGYVLSACPDSSYNSVIGGLSASYQYKRWNNSAGISLIHSENQDMRKGYFYRSSLNFAKNFTFSLQIENNIYDHFVLSEIYPDYREYLIRASLMYRW